MAGGNGGDVAWLLWPVDRAVAALVSTGRPVSHVRSGDRPVQGPGAELVIAWRDEGLSAPVTVVSAWFAGTAAAAWAEGGGVS